MWMQYIYPHKAVTVDKFTVQDATDLTWRFMSSGRRYVYCIVEKQKCYSPFVLQNKFLVYDLWSGTYCYYRSSSTSDLTEFYETSGNRGIAVMDDGDDVSFHSTIIDHETRKLDIGEASLSMGKSTNIYGNHRSSVGFSTRNGTVRPEELVMRKEFNFRNDNGITMVIPFESGISVIEMDSHCNIKKTDVECDSGSWSRSEPWQEGRMLYCFHSVANEFEEDEFSGMIISIGLETREVSWITLADERLKSFFDDPLHPVRLVRTIHRNNRLWVTAEKVFDKMAKVYAKEGCRWHEVDLAVSDTMVLIDVRDDGSALVLNVEKHIEGYFREDSVSFAVLSRRGVPSLQSIARKAALKYVESLRYNKHMARIIGYDHS
ncbi:hypothetical protein GCK32_005694 [Trichostrongylus colubriformis]|uniref:Uncharacterized protein n=1 Tax=Trichostrongylus colubriformis TaxID=6319 RepID=A0AAN8FXW2_TRICO